MGGGLAAPTCAGATIAIAGSTAVPSQRSSAAAALGGGADPLSAAARALPLAPPPQVAEEEGTSGAAWWALSFQPEGILLPGPVLQLGFKTEVRGHRARLGLYFGNLSHAPISLSQCSVTSGSPSALALTAAAPPGTLLPRGQALMMVQFELHAALVEAPRMAIAFSDGVGGSKRLLVRLPVLCVRFLQPWPIPADEYFRWWRTAGLAEKQANFRFSAAYDAAAVRKMLSETVHLAVLQGVDPVAANTVAAGSLAIKSGAVPPSESSAYCLLRLEVNTAAAGGAAARLTVRSRHSGVCEGLVSSLAAIWGAVSVALP